MGGDGVFGSGDELGDEAIAAAGDDLGGEVSKEDGLDAAPKNAAAQQKFDEVPIGVPAFGDGHAGEAVFAEFVADGSGADDVIGRGGHFFDLLFGEAKSGEIELIGFVDELGDASEVIGGGAGDVEVDFESADEVVEAERFA